MSGDKIFFWSLKWRVFCLLERLNWQGFYYSCETYWQSDGQLPHLVNVQVIYSNLNQRKIHALFNSFDVRQQWARWPSTQITNLMKATLQQGEPRHRSVKTLMSNVCRFRISVRGGTNFNDLQEIEVWFVNRNIFVSACSTPPCSGGWPQRASRLDCDPSQRHERKIGEKVQGSIFPSYYIRCGRSCYR